MHMHGMIVSAATRIPPFRASQVVSLLFMQNPLSATTFLWASVKTVFLWWLMLSKKQKLDTTRCFAGRVGSPEGQSCTQAQRSYSWDVAPRCWAAPPALPLCQHGSGRRGSCSGAVFPQATTPACHCIMALPESVVYLTLFNVATQLNVVYLIM